MTEVLPLHNDLARAIAHSSRCCVLDTYWRCLYHSMLVSKLCDRAISFQPKSASSSIRVAASIKPFADKQKSKLFGKDFAIDHRCDLVNQGYASGYIRTRLGYLAAIWEKQTKCASCKQNVLARLLRGMKKE